MESRVYGRNKAASELAATDPEHGMMEEVLAKFGDEKGLAIMIKPLPGRKATWAIRRNRFLRQFRKGSFCELLNNHREVRTVA